jgi:hypothetical protein
MEPEESVHEPQLWIREPTYCRSDVRFGARDLTKKREIGSRGLSRAKYRFASHADRRSLNV